MPEQGVSGGWLLLLAGQPVLCQYRFLLFSESWLEALAAQTLIVILLSGFSF